MKKLILILMVILISNSAFADDKDKKHKKIGPPGPQGIQGIDGIAGAQGIPGLPGIDGAPGAKGDTGIQGLPGPKGNNGIPGVAGSTGPKGDPGIAGVAGIDGQQGPAGIQGPSGVDGATGPKGDAGLPGVAGPQGIPGDQGIAGIAGVAGVAGIDGQQGASGDSIVGPRGDVGPIGPEGPQGPAGLPAVQGEGSPRLTMKDADGRAFGSILWTDVYGIQIKTQIQLIVDGAPRNFDLIITPNDGIQHTAEVYFTGRDCTGDIYIVEVNGGNYVPTYLNSFYGEKPLIGRNGGDAKGRPMYLPVGTKQGINILSLSSYTTAPFITSGCLNSNRSVRAYQVEEISPDLHTLYPFPYTLGIQ